MSNHPLLRKMFNIILADEYKNYVTSDDPAYRNTRPIKEIIEEGVVSPLVIGDPPYMKQGGNHNATNCDLKKSEGNMKKNDQYGTSCTYERENICALIVTFLLDAKKLLKPRGYVLLKVKDSEGVPMTHDAVDLAFQQGFCHVGTYVFANNTRTVITRPADYSTMLVFQLKKSVRLTDSAEVLAKSNNTYQKKALEADKKAKEAVKKQKDLLAMLSTTYKSHDDFKQHMMSTFANNEAELNKFLKEECNLSEGASVNVEFERLQKNGRKVQRELPVGSSTQEPKFKRVRNTGVGSMERYIVKKKK